MIAQTARTPSVPRSHMMKARKFFAQKMYDLMQEKRLTVSELERKTGIAKSNISHYKNGRSLPSKESMALLADVFGVSAEDLLPVEFTNPPERSDDSTPLRLEQVSTGRVMLTFRGILPSSVAYDIAAKIDAAQAADGE
jgi:transcriptional regulator with XRE-family HTH domain